MIGKVRTFIKQDGITVAIVLALLGAFIFLRTPGDDFKSMVDLESQLKGQVTIVEFYSNICSICLVSKPKVDQLERDLEGQASVLRLDTRDKVGMALAARWGVRGVPTFFVLNKAGEISYARPGAPDVEALKDAVRSLQNP